MSANLYDEAIVNKLQDLITLPNLHILKPDETTRLFEQKADESHDNITLPIIALSRRGYKILNSNKQPKTYDGIKIVAIDKDGNIINKGSALKLNAIPIQLNYQLDIYTTGLDECEAYSREFIFQLVNHPTGEVFIPYNDANVTHKFSVHLEEDVEDNSDIKERLFPSQFTRYTIRFVVDDAYLFSIPNKKNVAIGCIEVDVQDSQSKEIVEKIKVK